jgi:hypothetical protein
MVDSHVAAVGPAQLLQALHECRNAGLPFHIVRGYIREHADAPHALALLRSCCNGPSDRRAAEQRHELAPPGHSITSSARASNEGGTVMPSILAV